MAIGYARAEFVQRSNGKSVCAKAAYNSRSRIEFDGNCVMGTEVYDWSHKESPAFHEVVLPQGVHDQFKSPSALWNASESMEKRINSVVGLEILLALTDDQVISLEDRIHLARTFIQEHFVDKGLAAQIDIHRPEKKIVITRDHREIGLFKGMSANVIREVEGHLSVHLENGKTVSFNSEEFTGYSHEESNWHAHVLVTTRRFRSDGLSLGEKARDLMPRIAKGKVISGPDWGKLWTDHQNLYFSEKGIDLRVDLPGMSAQEHLGPYRMRGRAFSLLQEHGRIFEENAILAKDVSCVLEKITERQSVFTKEDVERFMQKHVSADLRKDLGDAFWAQEEIVPLVNTETGEISGRFSSKKVFEEEKRILRLSAALYGKKSLKVDMGKIGEFSRGLNEEQNAAYSQIVSGNRLACIHGYAGTGKSHLLVALRNAYVDSGYQVRAFGPDSATADVLKNKGFQHAENIYLFLFGLRNSRREVSSGKEVWILDEAGKLGNQPLLEFLREAEKRNVQVIFSGDYAQLNSVGRGGMFKIFCDRYSPHVLQQVQRQKGDVQREIAKNLAIGEFGSAIDRLSSKSGIRWSTSKKEAIEQLISCWAGDTRSVPLSSTLIIAHTNDEVRILNEMVRIIRKQRGELRETEFFCETSLGKVYLSVGDTIEFRKNEKSLGVTNGMSGVLVEARGDRFVVSVREGKKEPETIVFNPQEYHAYQLGYASTYFRSQGKTIGRAYVLHSPALNKRLFYVGLTRHVDEAYYFVSKDQAYCLSDLKRQAMREDLKENTLSYTTAHEAERLEKMEKTQAEIQALKESESFLQRVKGYGLSVYDLLKIKAHAVGEHIQDRTSSKEFYQVERPASNVRASVEEIAVESEPVFQTILSQEKSAAALSIAQTEKSISNVKPIATIPEEFFKGRQQKRMRIWNAFDPAKRAALEKYFSLSSSAASLRAVVDLQSDGSSQRVESTVYFKAWQKACGERNEAAHELARSVPEAELGGFIGKKMAGYVLEHASRYVKTMEMRERSDSLDLEEGIKSHIESLLYRLFPEGPMRREKSNFRFGSKGSLSVVCTGERAGQFYDFERQEGGGPLKLIQRELGLGFLEAKEWAKQFLRVAHEIKVPQIFQKPISGPHKEKDSEWVSLRPDPNVPAPRLEELTGRKLHHYFEEVSRHPYRDAYGQLLYYVLRLKDKSDASRKITPPLSYGFWKSEPDKLRWELKGYLAGKNCIYNLHHLREKPVASVLVVEGEKTADRALEKFPGDDLICVTWPGGAGAVRLTNWAPLSGRKVIVWPDNDRAGLEAGGSLCSELRRVGVQSLQVVDFKALRECFPEKWDLADLVPSQMKDSYLLDILRNAQHKSIDPQQLVHRTSSTLDKANLNEILWRVDERLRPALEATHGGQSWKISEAIMSEAAQIVLRAAKADELIRGISTGSDIEKELTWQIAVYRAQHGKDPAQWEVAKMKDAIVDYKGATPALFGDLERSKAISMRLDQPFSKGKTREEQTLDGGAQASVEKITREQSEFTRGRIIEFGGMSR